MCARGSDFRPCLEPGQLVRESAKHGVVLGELLSHDAQLFALDGDRLHQHGMPSAQMRVAFQAGQLHSQRVKLGGLLADDLLQLFLAQSEERAVLLQELGGNGRGRLLVEAGEAHGVVPGATRRAVAVVLGAGGGVLPGDGVAGVKTPQASVLTHPRRGLVDEYGAPSMLLPGADAPAVAARVVDEGDAERVLGPSLLTQDVGPDMAEEAAPAVHPSREAEGRRWPGTRPSGSRTRESRLRPTRPGALARIPVAPCRPSAGVDHPRGSRGTRIRPTRGRDGLRPRTGRPVRSPNPTRGRSRRGSRNANCCSNRRTSTGARSSLPDAPRGRSTRTSLRRASSAGTRARRRPPKRPAPCRAAGGKGRRGRRLCEVRNRRGPAGPSRDGTRRGPAVVLWRSRSRARAPSATSRLSLKRRNSMVPNGYSRGCARVSRSSSPLFPAAPPRSHPGGVGKGTNEPRTCRHPWGRNAPRS